MHWNVVLFVHICFKESWIFFRITIIINLNYFRLFYYFKTIKEMNSYFMKEEYPFDLGITIFINYLFFCHFVIRLYTNLKYYYYMGFRIIFQFIRNSVNQKYFA